MAPRKTTRTSKKAAEKTISLVRHPKETAHLLGQEAAEAQILQAAQSGHMPHAWLIVGPEGIGKATLAHRFARAVLTTKDVRSLTSLETDLEMPAISRMRNGSHGDFMLIEGRGENGIVADQVRGLGEFLAHTPSESAWRVVIVDSADAMNPNAANALLKTLEEPPNNTLLLLISHNPGKLLPTIRSRCRVLKLKPLALSYFTEIVREHKPDADPMELRAYAELAGGSPGLALALMEEEALTLYAAFAELLAEFAQRGKLDLPRLHSLAENVSGKSAAEAGRFEVVRHVLATLWARLALLSQTGTLNPELLENETEALQPLAQHYPLPFWLNLAQESASLLHDTGRIHLDRKQVLVNIIAKLEMRRAA